MAAATHLVIDTQPGNIPSGTGTTYPYVPAVVSARDGSNVIDTTYSGTLNVTLATGSGVISGPSLRLPFYNGVCTLRGIAVRGSGSHSFALASGSLTGATTNTFTVLAAIDTFYPTTGPVRAALPRSVPNTAMPDMSGATIYNVGAGQTYTTIQAAATAVVARPARIILKNGNAFNEAVIVPAKGGTGWLTIETETMPCAAGVRVKPSDYTTQATWVSPSNEPALQFAQNSVNIRVMGVRINAPAFNTSAVINCGIYTTLTGSIPDSVVIDRVCIQGNDGNTASRGVRLEATNNALINSHIDNIHNTNDCQACNLQNSPGPFLIENNYLEAATENIMAGGGGSYGPGYIPRDITVRYNLIAKPKGKIQYPGWNGQCKNLFELKEGHRVLVEFNVMQGFWDDAVSQPSAINLKSVNQDNNAPYTGTSDVVIRHNVLRNVAEAFAVAGHPQNEVEILSRVVFRNNVVWNINDPTWQRSDYNGQGRMFVVQQSYDILFDHNTFVGAQPPVVYGRAAAAITDYTDRTTIQNMLHMQDSGANTPIVVNAGTPTMNGALALDPAIVWRKNVVSGCAIGWVNYNQTNAPAGNTFLAVNGANEAPNPGFVDLAGARLIWETGDPLEVLDKLKLDPSSLYYAAGVDLDGATDSSDIGAYDINAIKTGITGVIEGTPGVAPEEDPEDPEGSTPPSPITLPMAADQKTANVLKGGDAQLANVDFTGQLLGPASNGLTAFAGGGQASATALPSYINRVTTVATAADSVKLPAAVAGLQITVINAAAANAMNVFPQTGEVINALAANAALSVAANKSVVFSCAVAGTWNSNLTA
jgi:hypothetical protein